MRRKVTGIISGWLTQYKNSELLQKFSTVLVVDILVKAAGFILLPIYLWLMTQEEYGIYNYILSIITTFSVILNFGLYVSQSKYYSDNHASERKKTVLFNIAFLLTLLLCVVLIPVYVFKADYVFIKLLFKNPINYTAYRWPILLALVVTVYTVILSNYFITSEKLNHFRKFNIYRLIVVNVVALAALFAFSSDSVNIRLLYTYLCELLVLGIFFSVYAKDMIPTIDWKIIANALKLGVPVMFSAVWGLLSNYSDKFFLEKYATPKDLSHYYLAFSISNVLYMICAAVQNAWLPGFLKEKDLRITIQKTKKLLNRLAIVLLVLSGLLVLGLYIAIKLQVISAKYWPAIYILPILLLAQVFNGILLLYSNYTIYLEKTHWGLFIGMFASMVGLTGSYFFIPRWNVFGAAIVYLVVQLTYYTIYYFAINYKIKTLILKQNNSQPNVINQEIL